MDKSEKLQYREPEIVAIGDVIELTGDGGSPVRDNNHEDPPSYFDANPPKPPDSRVELDD